MWFLQFMSRELFGIYEYCILNEGIVNRCLKVVIEKYLFQGWKVKAD